MVPLCVCTYMSLRMWSEVHGSPVAAAEQEPQDLASSLVLFFS